MFRFLPVHTLLLVASCLALCNTAASASDALVEKGIYLVEVVGACASCHTPYRNGEFDRTKHLAGGMRLVGDGYTAFASNITPDEVTGIGGWSDEEIVRAIREGKRPDGTSIGVMPFDLYRRISDRDALAMAAYLKSLEPVRNRVPKPSYTPPLPADYGPPLKTVPEPPRDDAVRRGAYLAGPIGRCVECHTPSSNAKPDYENQLGAGGVTFTGPWGESISGNITPDRETGLGRFSDDQIKQMIVSGVRPDGSRLGPPMAHSVYGNLAAEDLDAIVAYLRSLKPIRNFIDR